MKKWQYLLSAAVLLGSISISSLGLALTPGYYVRMEGDKLTGQLIVFNHKGIRCYGDKCKKDSIKVLSIVNRTNENRSYSLNASYTDLQKNEAVTDKALVYYGDEFNSFNGQKIDNVSRLYEQEEQLPLKLVETSQGVLQVTSEAEDAVGYLGTYVKEETFLQASHPLTIFTLEQQGVLPQRENRSYVITSDDNLGYKIIAKENGEPIAEFRTRIDLSKIVNNKAQDGNPVTLFISDYARKYEAQQAKKAKG